MPKSRNRRRRTSSRGRRPSDRPYRSITSQLTPAHERAVCESADAELRGDAATALSLHRSVPFFRRSTHGDRLQQLADLGPAAPGWLAHRWVTVQARRRMWTGGDQSGTNRALQRVNSGRKLEHVLDGRRRGEFHRSADETLGWTTKVHRPGESFVGQPMKLPKLTPNIVSAVLFLRGDRVIGRLAEFLDAA
jgi:hypothetical protein